MSSPTSEHPKLYPEEDTSSDEEEDELPGLGPILSPVEMILRCGRDELSSLIENLGVREILSSALNYRVPFSVIANMVADEASIEDWGYILELAEDEMTIHYIEDKLSDLTILPKPIWIRKSEGKLPSFDPRQASTSETLHLRDVLETFSANFNFKGDGEISEYELQQIAGLAVSTAETSEYDKVFGPLNAIPGMECQTGSGGCRMLTCRCRDVDQDEDKSLDPEDWNSWFEGRCDGCGGRIAHLWYALRQPVVGGGWVGCYCSVECIKRSPVRSLTQMAELLLQRVVDVIEKEGILDRV